MKEIIASEFENEVLKSGKVVLDFYSSECPPCEALAPKFESLAGLYGNDIKFVKIFRQKNKELADQLEVRSSPTLLFFYNGKEVVLDKYETNKAKKIIIATGASPNLIGVPGERDTLTINNHQCHDHRKIKSMGIR